MRSVKTERPVILIQGDPSNYQQKSTHILVRLDTKHDRVFLDKFPSTDKCNICDHRTELVYTANFVLYKNKSIVYMKHLGIFDSCQQELEQAVTRTISKEFSEFIVSESI